MREEINEKDKKRFVSLIAILIVFVVLGLILASYINDTPLDKIRRLSEAHILIIPSLFLISFALLSLFAIPTWPLAVLSGILFSFPIALLLTNIGAVIGATGAFALSRKLGRNFVASLIKKRGAKLERYDRLIEEHPFTTVFLLRLIPIFPSNIVNYLLGLTKVALSTFIIATTLGFIPAEIAFILAGRSSYSLNPYELLVAIVIILLTALIYPVFKTSRFIPSNSRTKVRFVHKK